MGLKQKGPQLGAGVVTSRRILARPARPLCRLPRRFEQRPWPSVDRWAAAGAAMEPTNAIFLAFIFYDLAHVLAHYPKLGGAEPERVASRCL